MSSDTNPTSSVSSTVPLTSQVGGHAGVMSSEDGSLLIKAALPLELKFYQNLSSSGFDALRPFTPKFFGVLKLEGQLNQTASLADGSIAVAPLIGDKKESLVLENLSHTFLKPNILDIKLGTALYDESASPEKVERMLKTARETTSLETGIRLTGFQVYDNTTGLAVNTPKSYGKSIKASDLPEGIARFFPVSTSGSSGLPPNLLEPILTYFIDDVQEIRSALAEIEMRMVGGSLLFVYEADEARASEGLKQLEEEAEGEEDDDDDNEDEDKKRPPYVVKLIDFAHTKLVPGEGPDEGVLKGVDTVLSLLRARLEDIKALGQSK